MVPVTHVQAIEAPCPVDRRRQHPKRDKTKQDNNDRNQHPIDHHNTTRLLAISNSQLAFFNLHFWYLARPIVMRFFQRVICVIWRQLCHLAGARGTVSSFAITKGGRRRRAFLQVVDGSGVATTPTNPPFAGVSCKSPFY